MLVSELSFPHLLAEREAQLTRELERRRMVEERRADERRAEERRAEERRAEERRATIAPRRRRAARAEVEACTS